MSSKSVLNKEGPLPQGVAALIATKLENIVREGKPKSITIQGKKYYISKAKIEWLKKEGGFQSEKEGGFLPLIPLILGGIAAAGSIAGGAAGIAKAVQDKNANSAALSEQQRHNAEMEKAAKAIGKGLSPDDLRDGIKGFVARINGLKKEDRKIIKKTLLSLAHVIDIQKIGEGHLGEGLFLSPPGAAAPSDVSFISPSESKEGKGIGDVKASIVNFVNKIPEIGEDIKKAVKKNLYHLGDLISIKPIKINQNGNGLYLSPF